MINPGEDIRVKSHQILEDWLASCIRRREESRNTIAIGMVVLDHLRKQSPTSREAAFTQGGELKGARGKQLGNVFVAYGIPRDYLKEATGRQAAPDARRLFEAFKWGEEVAELEPADKDKLLLELIHALTERARQWLKRQNLKLHLDRRLAPGAWIQQIVENARERSGGVVEQHLVGAKLERRFKGIPIANYPAHAADLQTTREGDFTVKKIVYHVTASPSNNVIQRCAENIRLGKHPFLLVPRAYEERARAFAEVAGIDQQLTIVSIEAFIALNVVELATEENMDFFMVPQEIIDIYNRRLTEVETDLSLQIEVR